mmetsp:Transcript_8971/g.12191  ORF Transcript_8971/g.12191 Transcript_8971/m.12191 type:complete len:307 (+) Transcript_8971:198-1118(+)|eukprot:CAMPEP_0196585334 /NCGR_PEP_ID=MMETSP1081-20130531/50289_1 /TAXON_ID=36882 /ORGANISM="Pyramimonas amylifera, Strain CCMP720" /LENGTH=306 /DNA_ID=CAMNT_0041906847 /DNA_START=197 /DNA_END=1117 /DNA_ORIENTATION=+
MSDSEESEGDGLTKAETRGQMTQRHKKEVKALKVQTAKMGKKKKEDATALEKEMSDRHEQELKALDSTPLASTEGDSAVEAISSLSFQPSTKGEEDGGEAERGNPTWKMSKGQRRRQAQAEKEKEREDRIAREKSELGETQQQAEDKALEIALSSQGLKMAQIKADGHCLFRSLAHSLTPQADRVAESDLAPDFQQLRAQAAAHLRANFDTFAPFMEGRPGPEAYESYCVRLEETAEWGGNLELQALAGALRRCITVHSVGMPSMEFGEEYKTSEDILHIAYLKHAYGLGEHYNAVEKKAMLEATE